MRVLNVNHLLDPISGGGTAERTSQLCRLFAQAGIECTLLTLDIGLTPQRRQELAGVRIVALSCVFRRFFVPQFSWRSLKREVAGAHVVHLMGHWTLLNALVVLAARSAGRPYVVCPAGALAMIGRSRLLKQLYNLLIGRQIIRRASGHIAITQDEIAHFSDYGVTPESVVVIPNGVPSNADRIGDCTGFLARHGLGKRKFVLFLGRLAYIKGPDLLLESFANIANQLPDFDLVFAGPDGGMLPELRQYAAQRGIETRVRFIGYVGGGDKACALQSCALLAIPSRREAMSIVALEAGIHGKPVLLTDQCGFNEVEQVGGGRTASVTSASIASVLLQMAANPEELALMGARLKAFVKQHYTWDQAVAKHLALFQQVVATS
jgi:glycosyltransferase involved in cell wall biosynthesis